jgi:hypothetical protein
MGCRFSKKKKKELRQPLFYKLSDELLHKYFSQDILCDIVLNYGKGDFILIINNILYKFYKFYGYNNIFIIIIDIAYIVYIRYYEDMTYFTFNKIYYLPKNSIIIKIYYNFDKIKETNKRKNEEIIKKVYHPLRIAKWINEINE